MEKITPGDIAAHAKYLFILNSLGLQYLRPLLYGVPKSEAAEPPYYTRQLKTPVWDAVKLFDNDNPATAIFMEIALVDATLPKIVKETAVQGRAGTVKEYIATGDWQLTIRGAVFSEDKNAYPLKDIDNLVKLSKLKKQIAVESQLINHIGVTNVVIKSLVFKQQTGCMNKMAFEISCISDAPYELEITA